MDFDGVYNKTQVIWNENCILLVTSDFVQNPNKSMDFYGFNEETQVISLD